MNRAAGSLRNSWDNDLIQFPRLLAEIRAIGLTGEQYNGLFDTMDLTMDEIDEIFERAEEEWQRIKEIT